MKFITNGKWDWEHGLGHYKRVAEFVKEILVQLHADERTVNLGMTAALLHDIGLIKGDKKDHAIESSKLFTNYISTNDVTIEEIEVLRQAIKDHSKGKNIQSLVGMSLVLADKLDVTYHRVEKSSIHDATNKEFEKIKKVSINISDAYLIVNYEVESSFNLEVLKEWDKAITIPHKVANYLNKEFIFLINGYITDISEFMHKYSLRPSQDKIKML